MASESGENVASNDFDVRLGERTPLLALRTHTLIDQMEHQTELLPAENIYSFHMFIVPVETRRKHSKCTMIVCFAYIMVVINLLMQFWLLAMVSNFVVLKNKDLSDSLVRKDTLPWYRAHEWLHQHWLKQEAPPSEACHDGSALCFQDGAYVTCAPPSIQVLKHWYLLDTNEDDLWSRSEAHDEDLRMDMQCKHNVDVSILFDEMLSDIQDTAALKGRLHSHITNGTAIPKAYFDWFIGEPMLCQYGDQDMCGNLFERGIFDGALRPENQHTGIERGIHDVQTARDYCTNLLTYRCDGLLPSTYRVWKVNSVDKCGDKDFVPVFYNPPGDLAGQWMLRVSFSQQSAYARAGTWEFMFYLASLLFVFFAVMYEECKSIYQVFQWWWLKPKIDDDRVQTSHIVSVFSINLIRTILFMVLLYSGIVFMQEDTDVLHLIFDALSLVFIIGIDEILYAAMVRKTLKDEHKAMSPVTLPRKPFISITVVTIECMRVGLLAICSLAICYLHMEQTLKPISKALRCLCTVEGEQCYEVAAFDASWWENYWAVTLSQAAADIDDMMAL